MPPILLAALSLVALGQVATEAADLPLDAELVEVERIWDRGPHNAFTDLIHWHGKFYCGFREGERHVGDRGKLRIIVTPDGERWESAALLALPDYDLRDAALSVTPDDQLMVLGGAQQPRQQGLQTGTFVSFSTDGVLYSSPRIILPPGRWLWRVTWHEQRAFGVSYPAPEGGPFSSLLVSDDGIHYQSLAAELLGDGGKPTEARIRFADNGTAYCLHRRDGHNNSAYFGRSDPPYTRWDWIDLKEHLGGPNFLQLPSGHWIGAGRTWKDGPQMSLVYLDLEGGSMAPLLTLPSKGDCSYPGLVWHDDQLWVSYYSSHESGTNIYLARVVFHPRAESTTRNAE